MVIEIMNQLWSCEFHKKNIQVIEYESLIVRLVQYVLQTWFFNVLEELEKN